MLIVFSGRKWALRVLRSILVVDPDSSDLEELRKCYLMAVSNREFYLTQLEIGLEQLVEKIYIYISVKDEQIIVKYLIADCSYLHLCSRCFSMAIPSILNWIRN